MDHEPEYAPAFHVPLTTARNADSSMSARRASGASCVAAVHVPEYSVARPVTVARQAPFQACSDLLADHPPLIRILPDASRSVQAPITPPLCWWASAVQVPPRLLPALEDALHEPRNSAPEASIAEQVSVASKSPTDIVLNLARLMRRRDLPGLRHRRPRVALSEVPTCLIHQPGDALHLRVIDSLGAVEGRVIVRMQAGVQKHGRYAALQKRPLVAAAQQVRGVVVVIHAQRQIEVAVCCAQNGGEVRAET